MSGYGRITDFTKREFQIVVTLSIVFVVFVCVNRVRKGYKFAVRDDTMKSASLKYEYLVDINKADWYELMLLSGIGEVKARAIVKYRSEIGEFERIEDLCEIRGIGVSTVNAIKDLIVVKQKSGKGISDETR